MATIQFGNAPFPDNVEVRHATKGWDGAGHTVLAQSRAQIGLIGSCDHITAGGGSLDFYHGFVSIGGERHDNAFWDYTIAKNGDAMQINDPLGHRMPWANGGTDGLEGGGPALIALVGANRLNAVLWSKEHVIVGPEDWTDAQLETSAKIDVYHLDNHVRCPYTVFPKHPTKPVDASYHHGEFTGKGGNTINECAGPWRRRNEAKKDALIVDMLKFYQHKGTGPAPVPPDPPKPPSIYPKGWNEARAKKRFGKMRRRNPETGEDTFHGFNPNGLISIMWLRRVKETGVSPQVQDHLFIRDNKEGPERKHLTGEIVTFENGWILATHADRDGWFWV